MPTHGMFQREDWSKHTNRLKRRSTTEKMIAQDLINQCLNKGKEVAEANLAAVLRTNPRPNPDVRFREKRRTGKTMRHIRKTPNPKWIGKIYVSRDGFKYFYPIVFEKGRTSTPAYKGRFWWKRTRQMMVPISKMYQRRMQQQLKRFYQGR